MSRTSAAYSPDDEKTIGEVDEGTEGSLNGEEGHGASSMNFGAVSFQGRRQGTMTGEGMD
jgi:hypothetical protein